MENTLKFEYEKGVQKAQRELLIAFSNYIELNNKKLGGKKTIDIVEYFIAINCG